MFFKESSINNLNNKLESIISELLNYIGLRQDILKAFAWFFAIALLFYFSALAPFIISYDSEVAAFRESSRDWVVQGRWTTAFIESFIFPSLPIYFLPTAIFCFFSATSYMLVIAAHNLSIKWNTYVAFPFFCAFPVWGYLTAYNSNIPSLSFGLFCTSLAACLFRQTIITAIKQQSTLLSARTILSMALQILLVATAIGAYQSFLFLFVCFGLGVIILTIISNNEVIKLRALWKILIILVFVSILSILLYTIILYSVLYLIHENLQYIDSYYRPNTLINNPMGVINNTLKNVWNMYSAPSGLPDTSQSAAPILIALGFLALVTYKQPPQKIGLKITILGLATLCLLTPFTLDLIYANPLPNRTYVGVSYVVWLFTIISLTNRLYVVRYAAVFAVGIGIFQVLYFSSLFATTLYIKQNHDLTLAASIYDRIASVHENFDLNKIYPIDFFGKKSISAPYSIANGSFFNLLDGADSRQRMWKFMRLIGFNNLSLLSNEDRIKLISHYENMPSWPARGSVKVVDGVTLIKLSKEP